MIKNALISVSNKNGILPFANFLAKRDIKIISTGGTAKMLKEAGVTVIEVSEYTGFPEIMDGRVKTLHPKIHGGLLAVRDNQNHISAMNQHEIDLIDLVVIDLYPFEDTVKKNAKYSEAIEQIDIGGPSMIRSAAKNHAFVTIITDPNDYEAIANEITANEGETTLATRKKLAAKAFARTASYDAAISNWFLTEIDEKFPERYIISGKKIAELNYGENPHQKAAFYAAGNEPVSLASAQQIQGSTLSYNNLNDASAALDLVSEFTKPAVAIIKHANPCGVAISDINISDAFSRALACDRVSAYGGIIAVNRIIDEEFALALGKLFVEVIIAPQASKEAIEILAARKKLKILITETMPSPSSSRMMIKTISGGFLVQEDDRIITSDDIKIVGDVKIDEATANDLHFAFTVAKHVKSNAIILAKNQATIGIGAGQMSRVDSVKIASQKAAEAGFSTKDAVLASDAFLPFADSVDLAAQYEVKAIIQPGGSIRDEEVIKAANKNKIAMIFTKIRHFRH